MLLLNGVFNKCQVNLADNAVQLFCTLPDFLTIIERGILKSVIVI